MNWIDFSADGLWTMILLLLNLISIFALAVSKRTFPYIPQQVGLGFYKLFVEEPCEKSSQRDHFPLSRCLLNLQLTPKWAARHDIPRPRSLSAASLVWCSSRWFHTDGVRPAGLAPSPCHSCFFWSGGSRLCTAFVNLHCFRADGWMPLGHGGSSGFCWFL